MTEETDRQNIRKETCIYSYIRTCIYSCIHTWMHTFIRTVQEYRHAAPARQTNQQIESESVKQHEKEDSRDRQPLNQQTALHTHEYTMKQPDSQPENTDRQAENTTRAAGICGD